MGKLFRFILAALFVTGLCLSARPVAAEEKTCDWTGGSGSNPYWTDPDNWSCDGGPDSSAKVTISGGIGIPNLGGYQGAEAKSLQISKELDFAGGKLTVSQGWVAMDGAVLRGPGTLAGDGQIGQQGIPATVRASNTFSGAVTINELSTLKADYAPNHLITFTWTLDNYGTIDGMDADGSVYMQGMVFRNYGKVKLPYFYFIHEFGTTSSTSLYSPGEWTNDVDVRVSGGMRLIITNDMVFKTKAFYVGFYGDPTPNVLDLNTAGVTFDGNSGLSTVTIIDKVEGDHSLKGKGPVMINTTGSDNFNAPLVAETGITSVNGTLNRAVLVSAGATLRAATQIIANNVVTNHGTIDGLDASCMFNMRGADLYNYGAVNVGEFYFEKTDGQVRLSENGTWGKTTHLHINPDVNLALLNSVTMNVATLTVGGADLQPPKDNLNIGENTLTLTGPMEFNVNGPARVVGKGKILSKGPLTMRTVGAELFAPTLQIDKGSGAQPDAATTTLYGRFDGPVEVLEKGVLALESDSQVFLNNNLTLSGALEAASDSLLTLSGKTNQIDSTFTSNGYTTFQSTQAQSFNGKGTMQAYELKVDNLKGVDLGAALTVTHNLNLGDYTGGDIRSTGSGVTLAIKATTTGIGDVWGKVTRPGPFLWDTPYSFGNQDVQVTFEQWPGAASTPSSMSVVLTKGPPVGLAGGIRWYRFSQMGGALYGATMRLRYTDSEVAPASFEPYLKLWRSESAKPNWIEVTGPDHNEGYNWFELQDVIPAEFADWCIGMHKAFLPYLQR